ncbi:MAG: 50S ribosomal protein L32 [Chloracidobacterium sp. CP2_5A]|nr:MAG: 50S ribosomal protein L32 [Chloracidobacterium sp. CP2_5A]
MPNPKRRHSSSRRGKRRAHDALPAPTIVRCQNCGAPRLPHRVCGECGYYRGRQVMTIRRKGAEE